MIIFDLYQPFGLIDQLNPYLQWQPERFLVEYNCRFGGLLFTGQQPLGFPVGELALLFYKLHKTRTEKHFLLPQRTCSQTEFWFKKSFTFNCFNTTWPPYDMQCVRAQPSHWEIHILKCSELFFWLFATVLSDKATLSLLKAELLALY